MLGMASRLFCWITDHRYVVVGATENEPIHWRCKRCGYKRYEPPGMIWEGAEGDTIARDWGKKTFDS